MKNNSLDLVLQGKLLFRSILITVFSFRNFNSIKRCAVYLLESEFSLHVAIMKLFPSMNFIAENLLGNESVGKVVGLM